MKKLLLFMAMALGAGCGRAEVKDAFKGFLPVTDKAMQKSLNGVWSLKVVKGISADRSVPPTDGTWGTIAVPGCWEAHGFCQPKYDYPDLLTGYYRTEFSVPREWRGQQVVLRLDGVLRGYDLWLNDQYVGSWESAYNTCLFDLTPYLRRRGPQQLAMRVYTRFKGYEFDCFDDWAANGIFRDVTLMAVPRTHLSDLTIRTKNTGEVSVDVSIANKTASTTVRHEILDDRGRLVGTDRVDRPRLWTAETPSLYTLRTTLLSRGRVLQTFEHRFGFRQISVEGPVLKLNGQPVKLRGVNAHATDPRTVKVIGDTLTLKDLRMMKAASVNFIRLSHYPREPRFYELADSLGFYLVDEVPFGFGDKHLGDRAYQDILLSRALATVQRDKNHPSVLVWSVGNENPLPPTCVEVGDYVGRLDPSRPYCFPQVGSYFRRFFSSASGGFPSQAPVYAPHYPTTGQIGGFYQQLDRPVIFTEYCHTLGISFEDHDRQWEIIERTPGIAGGSVWEWADQGAPFTAPCAGAPYGPEQRVFTSTGGGFAMNGDKGTDGLVYADRTPLPNYYELRHNYARAFVGSVRCDLGRGERSDSVEALLTITNRYDFLNLRDNVVFSWTLTSDRDTVGTGSFSADCQARSSAPYKLRLPSLPPVPRSLALLHFDIGDAQGLVFLHQTFVLNRPVLKWTGTGDPMTMVQQGPLVRAGRKPTLAERIKQEGRLPRHYLLPLDNSDTQGTVQNTTADGTTRVDFTLVPDTTDIFRAELGIAYLLDARIDRVQWIGQGPFASYPGRRQANRYGFWSMHKDDLYFEGNRMGVDACWLSDKDGRGVLISGDSLNINFEQTDRGIVVTVNAAVSGQGPKFARTAFPVRLNAGEVLGGTFSFSLTREGEVPRLFSAPNDVPAPFKPFVTQYDTYLMRFSDICSAAHGTPVILTAGQSNADGRVPLADLPAYIHYDYCQWSYGSGDFETATGRFAPFWPRTAKPGVQQCWGFDAVVYYLLEQHWQRPFYVIKHTVGGTSIDPSCKTSTHGLHWSADSTYMRQHADKSLLRAFMQQIDSCLSQLPADYDIKFLLWHQGETDQQADSLYFDNLKGVVAAVRRHLVEVTGREAYGRLPVVCGNYARGSRQRSQRVADALERMAREDAHFHVVDASDLSLLRDRLHFDARGAETLGRRVYDVLQSVMASQR